MRNTDSNIFISDAFSEMAQKAGSLAAPPAEDSSLRQAWFVQRAASIIREKEALSGRSLTACITTFGCQMNERDSEKIRGILEMAGFRITDDEGADLVIYNTCTVRENANMRVYGHLGEVLSKKRRNPDMKVALCGCMMQEKEVVDTIRSKYRFVDLVFGTHNIHRFAELLVRMLESTEQIIAIEDSAAAIVEDLPARRSYTFKSGVNIMYGCDNFCTYCIVPYVRGRERSRKSEDILREIRQLAEDGVSEVMLLGQNVNSYGKGLDESISFAELLSEVEMIDGIRRIRFMTSHPKDLSDELIEVMAASDKICPHLHLPLQSGSSALLKKMNRHYDKERYLRVVEKLRKAMPDLSLTTDIIVGFPGETDEDIDETLDVIRLSEFDSAFTFIYSPRTGTPAASWDPGASEEVIKQRFDRVLKEVQNMGRRRSSRFEGTVQEVLVEQVNRQDESMVTGRTKHNLTVHFPGGAELIGKYADVYLSEAKGFYYLGEVKNC